MDEIITYSRLAMILDCKALRNSLGELLEQSKADVQIWIFTKNPSKNYDLPLTSFFSVLTLQDLLDGSNLCILEASQESKRSFLS